jgi:hypothetical protein
VSWRAVSWRAVSWRAVSWRAVAVPVAIVVGYAVLALLLYRPLDPLATGRLPRGAFGDPIQMTWFLEWTAQALAHGRDPFRTTTYLDYPLGVNLAVNTLTPALGVLVSPVTLTAGPVAAFNLLLRLSYVASASSMCFVLRRWCSWWPACVAGGLLYGFGPYAISQGQANTHLVLLFNPFLPALFALLDELLVRRRHDPRRVGLLIGLVAGLQYLVDAEMLADAAILALIALALGAARSLLRGKGADVAVASRRLVRAGLPALAPFVLLAGLAVYGLLLGPRHLNGPVQAQSLLQTRSYDLLSGVIPTSNQAVRTAGLARTADAFVAGDLSENGGYLGVIVIAAFVAAAWSGRRHATIRAASLLAAVAGVLSLGHRLRVDGRQLALPLPEAALAHVPLLGSVVAARFALFTDLFVAAVVAIGIDQLHAHRRRLSPTRVSPTRVSPTRVSPTRVSPTRLGRRGGPGAPGAARGLRPPGPAGHRAGRRAGALLTGVAVLGLVSVLPAVPVTERRIAWPADLIGELRRVVPAGGVVMAYPYPVSPYDSAMGWAALDRMRFRLVGGYATVPGPPGSGHAQTAPDLVAPVALQETLAFDADGRHSPYPRPGPLPARAARADLTGVLRADDVSVVVDWPVGADPGAATQLFRSTLGRPTDRVGDVLIWRLARH